MSQTFIDWVLVEAKNLDVYRYEIFKVENPEHQISYRGFVIFKTGDLWVGGETLDACRSTLITLGQQNS